MNDEYVVVDATIVLKWVVEEEGTSEALALRSRARLMAPEPVVADCASILCKKVRRGELTEEEALLAARLLQASDIELVPTRALLEPALRLAIQLDQSAQECMCLALAMQRDCRLVTADDRFVRRIAEAEGRLHDRVICLRELRAQQVRTEPSARSNALLASLREGAVVRGTVRRIADHGAFLDIGGVEGQLHIYDMAWKRVKHPSEVVKVGEEIDVYILSVDRDRSRISLGLKQLGTDPWQNISRRYWPHMRAFGKVTSIAEYGALVEVEEGVEGLIHLSEMDWTRPNVDPADVVRIEQEVEVMILDVDEQHRRMSLGLKQCRSRPGTGENPVQ
jgi:predicted RNA-binding protein with RPS1 domain/predicted nucleic acid-binding protein